MTSNLFFHCCVCFCVSMSVRVSVIVCRLCLVLWQWLPWFQACCTLSPFSFTVDQAMNCECNLHISVSLVLPDRTAEITVSKQVLSAIDHHFEFNGLKTLNYRRKCWLCAIIIVGLMNTIITSKVQFFTFFNSALKYFVKILFVVYIAFSITLEIGVGVNIHVKSHANLLKTNSDLPNNESLGYNPLFLFFCTVATAIFFEIWCFQERWLPLLMGVFVVWEFMLYLGSVCCDKMEKYRSRSKYPWYQPTQGTSEINTQTS